MNFKLRIFAVILPAFFLSACSDDVDTPEDKRRSSYNQQRLIGASREVVSCGGESVVLPVSVAGQSLDRYILELHDANRDGRFGKLKVADLQNLYRDCIRPRLVERFY